MTAAPWRVSREATQPIRSMFVSRSSFEKPRPFERWVRTVSPSRYSTMQPRSSSAGPTRCAIVDLPAPERPVNQSVKPPPRTRSDSGCSWAWMCSVIRLLDQRCVGVGAARELPGAGPAARALVLARLHGARARDAADRGEAPRVQGVDRDLVHERVRVD